MIHIVMISTHYALVFLWIREYC